MAALLRLACAVVDGAPGARDAAEHLEAASSPFRSSSMLAAPAAEADAKPAAANPHQEIVDAHDAAGRQFAAAAAAAAAATSPKTAMASLAWSLRFAAAMGVVKPKEVGDVVVVPGKALRDAAAPTALAADDAATPSKTAPGAVPADCPKTAAWECFSETVVKHLDVVSATAMAGPQGIDAPPIAEVLVKRNRRLATLSRSLITFAPAAAGSEAAHDVAATIVDYLMVPSASPASSPVLEDNVALTVRAKMHTHRLHPLRVAHAALEALASVPSTLSDGASPVARATQARFGVVRKLLDVISSGDAMLTRALVTQALGHRCQRVRETVAPTLLSRTGPRPANAGGAMAAKEAATHASSALNAELTLLARLVAADVLTVAQVWALLSAGSPSAPLPHTDLSPAWFANVRQFTEELAAYGKAAKVDVVLDASALRPETLGTSEIIGNNFALMTYPSARPTWGLAFAVGGAVVPKITPVSLVVALLRTGSIDHALDLVASFRDDAGADVTLCPATATPHSNVGGCIADAIVTGLSTVATAAKPDGAVLVRCEAAWLRLRRAIFEFRSTWASTAALHAAAEFLRRALLLAGNSDAARKNHQLEQQWQSEVSAFVLEVAFPSLVTLAPSPMLGVALRALVTTLPLEQQRRLALELESTFQSEAAFEGNPFERIESMRQRTLLNACLNRISTREPRAFSGLLATVANANPVLVASRLISKAVGYGSDDLLLTNALLIRDAAPHFLWVLQVLLVERCFQAATKDDGGAPARITAMATFLALTWRHTWSAFDTKYIMGAIELMLWRRTRADILCATLLTRHAWRVLLSATLESDENRNTAQERALSAGPMANWYAGGNGEAFLRLRWVRGVCTPRLRAKAARQVADALREPALVRAPPHRPPTSASDPPMPAAVALVLGLLQVQAQVVDLYCDLPGSTAEIMRLQQDEFDVTGDLARSLLRTVVDHGFAVTRQSAEALRFRTMSLYATVGQALSLCTEAQQWRLAFRKPPRKSSNRRTAGVDSSPVAAGRSKTPATNAEGDDEHDDNVKGANDDADSALERITGPLRTACPNLPEFLVGDVALSSSTGGPTSAATTVLCSLFWSLQLSDIADDRDVAAAYSTADSMVAQFVTKSDAHLQLAKQAASGSAAAPKPAPAKPKRRGKFGKRGRLGDDQDENPEETSHGIGAAAANEAFGGITTSLEPEYEREIEVSAMRNEKIRVEECRALAKSAVVVAAKIFADADAAGELMSADVFAHACLQRRARLAPADAMFAVKFLSTLVDTEPRLLCWAIGALTHAVTYAVTFFVGFTSAEVSRMGILVRDAIAVMDDFTAGGGSAASITATEVAAIARRRQTLEAYLAQAALDLLSSCEVLPQTHRQTFTFLEKLRPVFPAYAASAEIVSTAARLHAQPSNPLFASASAVASAQEKRAVATRDGLVAQAAACPYGLEGVEALLPALQASDDVDSALAPTMARAKHIFAKSLEEQQAPEPEAHPGEDTSEDDEEEEEVDGDEAADHADDAPGANDDEFVAVAAPTAGGGGGSNTAALHGADDDEARQEAESAGLTATEQAAAAVAAMEAQADGDANAADGERNEKRHRVEGDAAQPPNPAEQAAPAAAGTANVHDDDDDDLAAFQI